MPAAASAPEAAATGVTDTWVCNAGSVEAAAAEKQARIDSGKDVIVGVNKYKLAKEDPIEILDVDNVKVRDGQIARLKDIKANRDSAAVKAALQALTSAAESGQGNLLDLSIQAIRLRATVGAEAYGYCSWFQCLILKCPAMLCFSASMAG